MKPPSKKSSPKSTLKTDLIKLVVFVVGIILFIVYIARPMESWDCRRNRFLLDDKINGIVSKKIYNSKSHNNEQIYFSNGDIFDFETNHYGELRVYENILMGDSIVKEEGSLILEIHRKDSSFVLDMTLPCDQGQ